MTDIKPIKTQVRFGYIILLILLVFFGSRISENLVSFKPDLQKEVIDLLTNLGVLTLVLERALEIYVSIWRGKNKIILEGKVERAGAALNFAKENNKEGTLAAQFEEMNNNLSAANQELEEYKDVTRTISLRVTLIIGIIVSVAGFRVLDTLFVSDALKGLQLKIYDWTDILLTAGVLSGGSAGIHALSNTLGTFFDETTKKLKKPGNQ
jgi:hypothetical protein